MTATTEWVGMGTRAARYVLVYAMGGEQHA